MPEEVTAETTEAATETSVDEQTSQNNQPGEETPSENQAEESADLDPKSLLAQKKHYRELSQKEKAARIEAENRLRALEEKELKDKEQYKELYESKEQELASLRKATESEAVARQFYAAISKHSPVDAEAAFKIADMSGVQVTTEGGSMEVQGIEEAVEKLVEEKAYLFNKGNKAVNSSASDQRSSQPSGTVSEWNVDKLQTLRDGNDIKTFEENKEEILKQIYGK